MKLAKASSPHRLRRLELRVRGVPTAAQALGWRSGLRAVADEDLAQALHQALDDAAAAHGLGAATVHLPHLALSLSLRSADELLPRLRQVLVQALDQALAAAPQASSRAAPAQRLRSLWMAYLAHGRVPWFDDSTDTAQLLHALREAAAAWLEGLAPHPGQAPWASEDALADWPHWPAAAQAAAITRLLRVLDAAGEARLRGLAQQALAAAGAKAADVQPGDAGVGTAPLPGVAFPAGNDADLAGLVRTWWQREGRAPTVDPARGASRPPSQQVAGAESPSAPTRADGASHFGPLPQAAAEAQAEALPLPRPDPAAKTGTSWLAHDAGLVLLHPFLPTLFQAIGCLAPDGRQLADGALPRAAAMLGWLLHGRDEVQEFELTLGRLLLGLAPDEALPLPLPQAQVDDNQRSEGQALLAAVVQHWSALGHTAPASLRTAFLARDGRLWRPEGQPWQLQMAEEAYDLLLGRLPWALGTLRLPWMPAPLQVQWGRA